MKFQLKSYKFFITKYFIKKTAFLLFYDEIYFNIKKRFLTGKNLKKIKYYKIYNSLTIEIIKKSIYANIKFLINSTIFFTHFNIIKKNLYLKDIKNLDSLSTLLCIKLNNKIYSKLQVTKVNNLDFQKNMFILFKKLKIFMKADYYKLMLIGLKL